MPTARIGDITIHCDTRGQGEPLLLIMGYRGRGFMWGEEFITLLSRDFQVISFDNRAPFKYQLTVHRKPLVVVGC